MNRIVCDTNVLLSGFAADGSPRRVLERIDAGQDLAFISRELLVEFDRVLRYPRVEDMLRRATVPREDMLRWVASRCTMVLSKKLDEVVVAADPSDDHVLACALSAGAEVIVSGDAHLLEIGTWRGIKILKAAGYLACLRPSA